MKNKKKAKIKIPKENKLKLKILEKDQEAFVLCLALGTLEAIRNGGWPLESAVWTLARPVFWEPLDNGNIPKEVIKLLSSFDELKGLELFDKKDYIDEYIEKMASVLRSRLASLSDKSWYAYWD